VYGRGARSRYVSILAAISRVALGNGVIAVPSTARGCPARLTLVEVMLSDRVDVGHYGTDWVLYTPPCSVGAWSRLCFRAGGSFPARRTHADAQVKVAVALTAASRAHLVASSMTTHLSGVKQRSKRRLLFV
jgi:hypothetical protein